MLKTRALAIIGGGSAALLAATPAAANYSTITSAVDWTEVGTALFAVAALIAGILVIRKGVRFVLGMVK